jgi:Amidases related to nicotinamidase
MTESIPEIRLNLDKKPSATMSPLCHSNESCLLVIDIQTRLTASMPDKVIERLKKNSTLLIKAAGMLSVPVIATRQYPQGLGQIEPEISEGFPTDCRYFDKTSFSCADAEDLMRELARLERKQIILTGIEAHICVLQTAIDLMQSGYMVFIVSDAVSSRHRENYENAIHRMQQTGAIISNTESVLFEWLRDARHEHFRTISAMIK